MSRRQAASAPPQLPGYTFERLLGTGGYSDVFLYEKARPRMKVAVKVLRDDDSTASGPGAGGTGAGVRLTAEADLMAQVSKHPYIVTIHDADTSPDGRQFIVMEYYPGDTLAQRAKGETITVAEVLRLGIQLCGAVETAHRFGIIHRDIKPANILTDEFRHPRLTDFGIAGKRDEEQDGGGMSVPWSPPEVVRGHAVPDELSDVYSLGATLWHTLTGRSPFEVPDGDNSMLAVSRRIETEPVPWTGRKDVPQSLERVLQQAMAKNPGARFGSPLHLARALQAVQQELGHGVVEPEVPHDQREVGDTSARPVLDGDADATDFRPQRVQAHSAPEEATATRSDGLIRGIGPAYQVPGPMPGPTAGAGVAFARQGLPGPPQVNDTVARSGRSPHQAPDTGPFGDAAQPAPPRRSPMSTALVVAGVLAAVTAASTAVVYLSNRGSPSSNASAPAPASPTEQDVLAEPPPAAPSGSATRISATKAHFSWTVPDPSAVAFYVLRRSDQGSGPRPDGDHVTVTTLDLAGIAPGATPCLDIQSGNRNGATSAPVRICAPASP